MRNGEIHLQQVEDSLVVVRVHGIEFEEGRQADEGCSQIVPLHAKLVNQFPVHSVDGLYVAEEQTLH